MCQRIRCRRCGKPSWEGCGAHVEHALAGVPLQARCRCPEEEPRTVLGTKESAQPPAKQPKLFGLFSRVTTGLASK